MSRVRPFSWPSNIPRCGRTTSSSSGRPLMGTQAASRSCLLICGIRRTEVLWGGVCVHPTPRSARASRPRRPRPWATCPQPSVLCFLHADGVVGRRPGALGVSVSACAFAAPHGVRSLRWRLVLVCTATTFPRLDGPHFIHSLTQRWTLGSLPRFSGMKSDSVIIHGRAFT